MTAGQGSRAVARTEASRASVLERHTGATLRESWAATAAGAAKGVGVRVPEGWVDS